MDKARVFDSNRPSDTTAPNPVNNDANTVERSRSLDSLAVEVASALALQPQPAESKPGGAHQLNPSREKPPEVGVLQRFGMMSIRDPRARVLAFIPLFLGGMGLVCVVFMLVIWPFVQRSPKDQELLLGVEVVAAISAVLTVIGAVLKWGNRQYREGHRLLDGVVWEPETKRLLYGSFIAQINPKNRSFGDYCSSNVVLDLRPSGNTGAVPVEYRHAELLMTFTVYKDSGIQIASELADSAPPLQPDSVLHKRSVPLNDVLVNDRLLSWKGVGLDQIFACLKTIGNAIRMAPEPPFSVRLVVPPVRPFVSSIAGDEAFEKGFRYGLGWVAVKVGSDIAEAARLRTEEERRAQLLEGLETIVNEYGWQLQTTSIVQGVSTAT